MPLPLHVSRMEVRVGGRECIICVLKEGGRAPPPQRAGTCSLRQCLPQTPWGFYQRGSWVTGPGKAPPLWAAGQRPKPDHTKPCLLSLCIGN